MLKSSSFRLYRISYVSVQDFCNLTAYLLIFSFFQTSLMHVTSNRCYYNLNGWNTGKRHNFVNINYAVAGIGKDRIQMCIFRALDEYTESVCHFNNFFFNLCGIAGLAVSKLGAA